MEYLTVRDVAALVRRNEETIRRMIRARKLDVTLEGNNRRQGYMIPVEQLTSNWDISPEEVQRYLDERRAHSEAEAPARMPLGPERPRAEERAAREDTDDMVRSVLRRSEQLIAREMKCVAERARGANTESGDEDGMSGERNKWVNTDGREAEQESCGAQERRAETDGSQREWHIDGNLGADLAAAGERVSEIIGDAYRQIRSALDQAGAGGAAAPEQDTQERYAPACDAGEGSTAERVRRARERSQAAIRRSIDGAQADDGGAADSCGADAAEGRGTGGWADNIRPLRDARRTVVEEAPQPAQSEQPAPEVGSARAAGLDFEVPEVTRDGLDGEDNASYRLLKEARRAVEERMRAWQGADSAAAHPEARLADEERMSAAQPATDVEFAAEPCGGPAEDASSAAAPEAEPAPGAQPAAADAVPQLPTRDEDAMQRRINELEAQLARLSGQLERLTGRLLGEDKDK